MDYRYISYNRKSMTYSEIDQYLLSFANTWKDFPFGESTAVYKIGHKESGEGKMFALVTVDAKPLNISLKTDPGLSENLRERYEEVQAGYHLNKKHWITIISTGQLDDEEIKDLARLSYQLVAG